MRQRSPEAEIQGPFSPLIPPLLLDSRLRAGRMVFSAAGLEKQCPKCHEFWPFDTEFFFANAREQDGLYPACRACYVERRWPNGRTVLARQDQRGAHA